MKICDLTQFYSPFGGGVRRYLQEKIAYLRAQRPDCEHILIIPGDQTSCERGERTAVYTIKSPLVSRTSRYRMLFNLGAVETIIERENPDVIESGDPYQLAWKAQATGEALRIPVVGFYHSHFPEAYVRTAAKFLGPTASDAMMDLAKRYVGKLYGRFSRTFVPSAGLEKVLNAWGVHNTTLIELGVDTAVFRPDPPPDSGFRQTLGIRRDAFLLLYVGRLAPEKNVKTLFFAFEQLQQEMPGRFHLHIVGDGTTRDSLERLREVADAVTWQKFCADSRELAAIYRAADLFVHPGIQETFGLVTLESQACGTPVVGIRGSYMDRIIFTDQSQWAVENSPRALARAIVDAASRVDLQAAGFSASERVRARYDWKIVFCRLFELYESVRRLK